MRDRLFPLMPLIAVALFCINVSHARAQQSTSATYQDWVLQCAIKPGPPSEQFCDIAQVTQITGKNVPFSRVSISQPVKGQADRLTVQLPVNISIATNVRIQTSDTDPGVVAPLDRCIPAGCFADLELKSELLKKFRAIDGTGKFVGKIRFKDAGGHEIAIPLSFKGFRDAFDALAKK